MSPSSPRTPNGRRIAERPPRRTSRRTLPTQTPTQTPTPGPTPGPTPDAPRTGRLRTAGIAAWWLAVALAGCAALVVATFGLGPEWLDGAGSVAVVTAASWALAARTGGRPLLSAAVALALGLAALLVGGDVLRTGASVMTCVVVGVLAVMATTPAAGYLAAAREVCVAILVGVVGAVAAVGFEPAVDVSRFEYATLLLGLLMALALVHRLGAGLHGLGRRGLVIVVVGAAVLLLTLAYAELLRRYGISGLVEQVLDFVAWTRDRIGAFPRPLLVLLGVPALAWGCHMRARRRQGWWVCAFGVAATVPITHGLVNPGSSLLEVGLQIAYSVVLGLLVGYLLVRADLLLTGSRGSRARREEQAAAHRPEPSRFQPL